MTTLILDREPAASKITIRSEKLIVDLADGRTLVVPLDGIHVSLTLPPVNGRTGFFLVRATRSSGRTLMNTSGWRVFLRATAAVKAVSPLNAG